MNDDLTPNLYDYSKMIKTPDEMGINDNGTWNTVMYNLDAMGSYVQALTTGKRGNYYKAPAATKANGGQGGPLGGRFFLNTGGKCTDKNGNKQDRYSYMNNVARSSSSSSLNELRGIVPGIAGNLIQMNPLPVFNAFVEPTYPKCTPVRMQTIDINGTVSSQTRYMADSEIKTLDPCAFDYLRSDGNRGHELAGWRKDTLCRSEGFTNMAGVNIFKDMKHLKRKSPFANLPDDSLTNIYILLLSFFGIYIVKRLTDKK